MSYSVDGGCQAVCSGAEVSSASLPLQLYITLCKESRNLAVPARLSSWQDSAALLFPSINSRKSEMTDFQAEILPKICHFTVSIIT